jgi:hypothetical protein
MGRMLADSTRAMDVLTVIAPLTVRAIHHEQFIFILTGRSILPWEVLRLPVVLLVAIIFR